MKALFLAAVCVAGVLASLAFASPAKHPKTPTTTAPTTTGPTTTTSAKQKCDQVELKGGATAGSFTFTVTKANKRGRELVGTQVTLVIPAAATVKAKACSTASGPLTLRDLHVRIAPTKP